LIKRAQLCLICPHKRQISNKVLIVSLMCQVTRKRKWLFPGKILEVSQRVEQGGIIQLQKYTGLLLAVLLLVIGRGKQAKLQSCLPEIFKYMPERESKHSMGNSRQEKANESLFL
jgi:hypothetical protein